MDIIKVFGNNLKKYRTDELNILNSIISSKNIEEDFEIGFCNFWCGRTL